MMKINTDYKRRARKFRLNFKDAQIVHLAPLMLCYQQYVSILRELELKMKAEILEKMKRRGTAAPNLTESDIDLDLNYTSDIESR